MEKRKCTELERLHVKVIRKEGSKDGRMEGREGGREAGKEGGRKQ